MASLGCSLVLVQGNYLEVHNAGVSSSCDLCPMEVCHRVGLPVSDATARPVEQIEACYPVSFPSASRTSCQRETIAMVASSH